jgi:pyruvate,water dikinase
MGFFMERRCTTNRQELGLSIEESSMPVVIQEMVYGDASGVVFSVSPEKPEELMIEAVHGCARDHEKEFAEEALRIGRRSWKLRDDDNIVLGQFEKLLSKATAEAKKRLLNIGIQPVEDMLEDEVVLSLSIGRRVQSEKTFNEKIDSSVKPRQLVGQPAGPGLVTGRARIIDEGSIFDFKEGEILVCDSIDPNMTFIVPLASGIIERRGGMLIHGAIIAREYGIPCVTGISNASQVIKTGDIVTVDGYLGIVTINKSK